MGLRGKGGLRVLCDKLLRIFGPKRYEVTNCTTGNYRISVLHLESFR